MGKISLYYNTIIHLNVKQIIYQCLFRFKKTYRKIFKLKFDFTHYRQGRILSLSDYIAKYESCSGDDFVFLNLSSSYDGLWENKEYGALWSFNINYMEFILQPSISFADAKKWIMRFIDKQHCNEIGMSSYCISLRGINWIKFITTNRSFFTDCEIKKIETSLYSQYCILYDNIEYNIGGNHLLENYFSLLWAAFYFNDEKMYEFASSGLQKELSVQTLCDGANFEQSPMYHCIMLDRTLDALNLLKNNDLFVLQKALYEFLNTKSLQMLGWLQHICYKDGSFPLFNDSAEKIAPTAHELFDYAKRLGLQHVSGVSDVSGYYAVDCERYELRMDMGGIAASYIPGHSHADTFNFELRSNGKPFITDSGITTYQWCDRRLYERSTAAHNTVSVNDDNSSCIWAAFRCAQRATVYDLKKNATSLSASHNGFAKYGTVHTRRFSWSDDSVEIFDLLSGDIPGKAYLHFAPDTDVKIKNGKLVTSSGIITFENNVSIEITDCEVSVEYNSPQKSKAVCVVFKHYLKTNIMFS